MAIGVGNFEEEEEYTGGFTIGSAMQEDLKEEAKKLEDGSMLHPHWNEEDYGKD